MNHRTAEYEGMTNLEVTLRYRLDKGGSDYLETIIGDELSPNTLGARNVSSVEKLLAALRYYASGELQLNDGDLHHLSQPSVSRAITQVTSLLSRRETVSRFIHFPLSLQDVYKNKADFKGICNFDNVVGVVDGTHVQIRAPRVEEESYVNRMGYHSINTQVIFNGRDTIIDLVARWPGATHDSRILRESGVCQLFEGRHVQVGDHGYLLGDSGYPCKKWLLTPYIHPAPGQQTNYNRAHKRTRASVERGIGQLKRRWGILHTEVRLNPDKVCKVILACGVLHNICKARGVPLYDIQQQQAVNNQNNIAYHGVENGLRYRDFIVNTYF